VNLSSVAQPSVATVERGTRHATKILSSFPWQLLPSVRCREIAAADLATAAKRSGNEARSKAHKLVNQTLASE